MGLINNEVRMVFILYYISEKQNNSYFFLMDIKFNYCYGPG